MFIYSNKINTNNNIFLSYKLDDNGLIKITSSNVFSILK